MLARRLYRKKEIFEYYESYDQEDFSKKEVTFINEFLINWDRDNYFVQNS